jgi:predicted metal-dependent phosphoesterase TrpH
MTDDYARSAPRVDLHTHSSCSDGLLSPEALVALAARRAVALLALTDHDTLLGCAAARAACAAHGIGFISGIELSCDWRGREIHVVGLRVDELAPQLLAHCAGQLERRRARIGAMAERLARAGLPGAQLGAMALAAPVPTRTHLARALCTLGFASSVQAAFEHWLKRGNPGYVGAQWPSLLVTTQQIIGAGGIAVLAHPHRYALSAGVLRELVAEFKAGGGEGIEVSLAGIGPGDADRLAALARRYELLGSIGSDFHEPDLPWRPLGRFAKLHDQITPIMARLAP